MQEVIEQRIATKITNVPGCPDANPVVLTMGITDVTVTVGEESVRLPIRMKALYNAAWTLARHEASNPEFAMRPENPGIPYEPILPCQAGYNNGDCLLPGMIVSTQLVDDECEYNDISDQDYICNSPNEDGNWRQQSTIVTVTDTTTTIDGQNPQFRFAVQNRHPALGKAELNELQITLTNMCPIPGIPITITAAIDPDEQTVHALLQSTNQFLPVTVNDIAATTPVPCEKGICQLQIDCLALGASVETVTATFCTDSLIKPNPASDMLALTLSSSESDPNWPRDCRRVTFEVATPSVP